MHSLQFCVSDLPVFADTNVPLETDNYVDVTKHRCRKWLSSW